MQALLFVTVFCTWVNISRGANESSADAYSCPLATVVLKDEMPRLEAEKLIAIALGQALQYSPYGNSLRGGIALYRVKHCVLRVTYRPGAAAALLSSPDGQVRHQLPRDETVMSFELGNTAK